MKTGILRGNFLSKFWQRNLKTSYTKGLGKCLEYNSPRTIFPLLSGIRAD